jgi:nitrous oxide reductase
MAEEDAKALSRLYMKYAELSNDLTRLTTKPNQTEAEKAKIKTRSGKIGEVRKEIVDMETNYASLFNHTADSRAANKAVTWYLLNLSYLRKNEEEEADPIFKGETFQDKVDEYYRLEEEGSELYHMISSRLATYVSYWYYSAGAVTEEDFKRLQEEIDNGEI